MADNADTGAEKPPERIKDPQTVAAILTAAIADRAIAGLAGKVLSPADLPKAIVQLYRATLAELERDDPEMSNEGIFRFYEREAAAPKKE
jgi:hypothetical protein